MTTCTRSEIVDIMEKLPEETSFEEAMERLHLVAKIKKGLKQMEEGEVVSHEEAKERLSKWLE
jgi:predicted transcriptional regulator